MTDLTRQDTVAQTPKTILLQDYRAPAYLIDNIELTFHLSASLTRVESQLKVRRNRGVDSSAPLVLDGQLMKVISVAIDGKLLSQKQYSVADEQMVIQQVPDAFMLAITTETQPDKNTALEGLYASGSMLCTQCEAQGFRRITYFPDRPDVMSTYRVKLIADKKKYPVLLSNGNLIESGEMGDGQHYAIWQDPSLKPSYLFALVAGDLAWIEDHFTTMSGRQVLLRVYTEHENIHKCDHAMHSLKQAMQWDEETFGREYDLDIYMIVAVNDFNMGAMENKGLNIFNASCVLASAATATDDDFYHIQSIIGHEYFHNWSGNRVTCRDWFQLSLKEGFTVFRDQEFSSDLNSRAVKRIDDVNVLRSNQFAEDSGPMAHPVRPDRYIEISNFYTVTVYNKGAEVVRMIRTLVGDEGFRKGTDLYFMRHDGQAVTCDDFVRAMEDANQIDLTQFKRWYAQAGTPELSIETKYDAATKTYALSIEQHTAATPGQPDKEAFQIPLAVGLIDQYGHDIPLSDNTTTQVLNLQQQKQTFEFRQIPHKPVLSVLRGFSAPVKVKLQRSADELAFLLAHDSDAFNRWDAGQSLALIEMMRQVKAHKNNEPLPEPVALCNALGKAMQDDSIDKALLAMILTLPSESYIADQCDSVDADAIYHARLFTRRYLAKQLRTKFFDLFKANEQHVTYVFNDQEMARRALKNVCLGYLAENETQEYFQLCFDQFSNADNMTEVQAALSILSNFDHDYRTQALAAFYAKWHADAQVVDKWLGIQARSRLPGTLANVRRLMQHPCFSFTNPNKIRALLGIFCRANPVRFHALDGSGYEFLTENVLKLDQLNPQITARLVQAISRWRRFEEPRASLMREQLEKILHHEKLSKDTYEVVSKSLAG